MPVVIADFALCRAAAAVSLPLELILYIIELVVVAIRDVNLHKALTLGTISRNARNSVLPHAYEILHIDIKRPEKSSIYVGWDGHEYHDRGLACLSWLLCNPDAAPRRHVRHLVFSSHDMSDFEFLPSLSPQKRQTTWKIQRITFGCSSNDARLAQIGISGAETQTVAHTYAPVRSYEDAIMRWIPYRTSCSFRWVSSDDGRQFSVVLAPIPDAGVHFLELKHEMDLLEFSPATWRSLKSTMEAQRAMHIVIVCREGSSDSLRGNRLIDVLRLALPLDILKRTWISATTWNRDLMDNSPLLAHARLVQSGEDPWNRGLCIGSLI